NPAAATIRERAWVWPSSNILLTSTAAMSQLKASSIEALRFALFFRSSHKRNSKHFDRFKSGATGSGMTQFLLRTRKFLLILCLFASGGTASAQMMINGAGATFP